MSDEKEIETTTKKVISNSNTPVHEYRVSEERTSRVGNNFTGLISGLLFALVLGVGASLYFLNLRSASTIVLPGATNTVKENKSTTIERNNTNTKETAPQPAPNVEVNVPAPAVPKVEVNIPAPTVTAPQPTPPNSTTTPPSSSAN